MGCYVKLLFRPGKAAKQGYYARKHGLADPRAAYDLGADKLDDVLAWCSDLAIPAVTLWVCSIDNLKRPQTEVAVILAAVEAKILRPGQRPPDYRRRVRVKAVGRLDLDRNRASGS